MPDTPKNEVSPTQQPQEEKAAKPRRLITFEMLMRIGQDPNRTRALKAREEEIQKMSEKERNAMMEKRARELEEITAHFRKIEILEHNFHYDGNPPVLRPNGDVINSDTLMINELSMLSPELREAYKACVKDAGIDEGALGNLNGERSPCAQKVFKDTPAKK